MAVEEEEGEPSETSRPPCPAYVELLEVMEHASGRLQLPWERVKKGDADGLANSSFPTIIRQCPEYTAVGQAGAALHTMAVLQAYQADLPKDLDQGQGLSPEAVEELRRTTDLALWATKQTAASVERSMAAMVATERHLWLNIADIGEKEKGFLLDAPVSPSELFGTSVKAVVGKFIEAKACSAFKTCITLRSHSGPRHLPSPFFFRLLSNDKILPGRFLEKGN
ncbi:hypothetical protein DPX16_17785 [Anabarilius grahami]|uniref:Uncharacterized protein n=1 Tax=Anabarilius grahami TaxID=495550 RepID=A0A3N0YHE7_ANAGA|nr:hypothetical protein DPX16_17785 [Anabarilius grahami]